MKIKWRCTTCNDEIISDGDIKNQMDYCKCGKSAMNLNNDGYRIIGDVYEIGWILD